MVSDQSRPSPSLLRRLPRPSLDWLWFVLSGAVMVGFVVSLWKPLLLLLGVLAFGFVVLAVLVAILEALYKWADRALGALYRWADKRWGHNGADGSSDEEMVLREEAWDWWAKVDDLLTYANPMRSLRDAESTQENRECLHRWNQTLRSLKADVYGIRKRTVDMQEQHGEDALVETWATVVVALDCLDAEVASAGYLLDEWDSWERLAKLAEGWEQGYP